MTATADKSKDYTKSLLTLIKRVIDNSLADMHVGFPAKVVKYDYATQKADVQPLLKRKFADGDVVKLPVIVNVPVIFPRVSESYVYLPLKVDDKVWIMIADYSIDNWLSSGSETDPNDVRTHNITDAVCIVGGYDFNHPITDLENDDDVVIKNSESKVVLKPTGKFKIVGDDGVDLVEQAYNLADEGNKATTTVAKMPISSTPWTQTEAKALDNAAAFGTIKTALAKIKV
jgi:hypothetical protein